VGKRSSSLWVVLLLLGLSLFGLAAIGQSIYSRLSYFWVLLLLGNWVWSKFSLRGLEIRRSSSIRRGAIGQVFEERYQVKNNLRLPKLWLEVKDGSKLPGSSGSRVYTLIGGRQVRSTLSRTRLVKRGVYQLGPTTVTSGDPFGFFQEQIQFPAQDSLWVFPMIVEIEHFPGPPGLLPGGEALHRRTHQITPNAAGIRQYLPGDSFNRIHWKSTARRNELMVKEFELDPLAEAWILVDGQRAVHNSLPYIQETDFERLLFRPKKQQDLAPDSEEYAATAAASITRYYLRRGRSVGLMVSSETGDLLAPDRGPRQLDKILEALALYKADGHTPFAGVVTDQCRHLPRGSTVVLITPSTHDDIPLVVDQLIRLGLRPVLIMINAASFGGAPGVEKMNELISSLGVPTVVLSNEDDIAQKLSFSWSHPGALSIAPERASEII